jgi:molecular chaperone GrpE
MSKDVKIENMESNVSDRLTIENEEMGNGKADFDQSNETKRPAEVDSEREKKSDSKKKSYRAREKQKKELEKVKKELEQFRDQYLRKAAEFENFRKRKEREVLESWELAKAELIKKFLPVLDDLDRTLEAAKKDENFEALAQGLELVNKAFQKILAEENVEVIEAVGVEFNPEFHDAMLQMEKEGVAPNIVIEESQKGYKKGERVLRPSKVVVSK